MKVGTLPARAPWREVIQIDHHEGPRGGRVWHLTLSCGHVKAVAMPRFCPERDLVGASFQGVQRRRNFEAPNRCRCILCSIPNQQSIDFKTARRAGKIYALSAAFHDSQSGDAEYQCVKEEAAKWAESQLVKMGINPHETFTISACVEAANQPPKGRD